MRRNPICFGARAIAGGIAAAILLLGCLAPAAAQEEEPLAFRNSLPGHDAAASRRVLAEHFAGVWQVVHTDAGGQQRSGRAEIAGNGDDISLVLSGPDGPEYYRLVEADALRFAPGSGPFLGSLSARFSRSGEPVVDSDGQPTATAEPFPLPSNQGLLSFKKGEHDLDLPVIWKTSRSRHIRVDLSAEKSENKYEGIWSEELGNKLTQGGLATWIRGEPRIAGVLVVDNQLDPSAGNNYPFTPDGKNIHGLSRKRQLVVFGENLPDMADRAAIDSLSPSVSYSPDFTGGADRQRTISTTFERYGIAGAEQFDAFIVTANLTSGVTPGTKALSVNGAAGSWPLLFADQAARLRFARNGSVPTEVFYEGDEGFVEVSFQTEMPFKDVAIRLLRGDENPEEIGVLLATRQDDDDPLFTTYRSDTLQLYSRQNERLSPPTDENALRVPVIDGMVLQAELLDRAEALTLPPVVRARIFSNPSQLGALWKEALNRVAKCSGDTIDDYESYQHEEAENVSKLIVTELGFRDISLKKGDHAAALLIRDEFVELTLELLPKFKKQAANIEQARAARALARQRPDIAAVPFWRNTKTVFVKEGFFWDQETEYWLAETLDVEGIAEQQGVTPDAARAWAEEQTLAAARAHVEKMDNAAGRALEAGDCDIGELLLIAGHKSDRITARIMPRLVRLQSDQGPPQRQYWVPDKTAQGYVKSLHIAGAAVRALEQYAEADTQVAAAIAAIATFGLSAGLEAAGYAAASLWVSLTDSALGVISGLVGVDKYFEGEANYDYALGASSALGNSVVDAAMAQRQSALMTALGVLLPAASGASNLKELSHFKKVQNGRKLFQATDGILDDLASLPKESRVDLTAYYADMLRRVRKSGLDKLDDADRAAFSAFEDYIKAQGIEAPSVSLARAEAAAETPSSGPEPAPRPATDLEDTVRVDPAGAAPDDAPRPAPDLEDTVRVDPASSDPNEMATQINPNPGADLSPEEAVARPQGPRPGDAVNIYEQEPGYRVADRPEGYLEELIEKSASGADLTAEEVLDKLDYMRLERQRALEEAEAAGEAGQ